MRDLYDHGLDLMPISLWHVYKLDVTPLLLRQIHELDIFFLRRVYRLDITLTPIRLRWYPFSRSGSFEAQLAMMVLIWTIKTKLERRAKSKGVKCLFITNSKSKQCFFLLWFSFVQNSPPIPLTLTSGLLIHLANLSRWNLWVLLHFSLFTTRIHFPRFIFRHGSRTNKPPYPFPFTPPNFCLAVHPTTVDN